MRTGLHHMLLAVLLTAATTAGAAAQSPEASPEAEAEPYTPLNRRVESADLAPVQLPPDLWRGLDAATIEKRLGGPDGGAPRSPALHQLWRRLLLTPALSP